jgi:hypothetical protein
MRFDGSSRKVISQITGTYIFDYFVYKTVDVWFSRYSILSWVLHKKFNLRDNLY